MPTEQERIKELQARLDLYEKDGAARLFYALNRKLNEMATMLNNQSLTSLDLTDAKDKSFERLKTVWNDAAGIATAVRTLGEIAGVTKDETKDTNKPIFRIITTPESISNVLGNSAGQNS